MACIIVKYPDGTEMRYRENQNRRFVPGEEIIGIDYGCNPEAYTTQADLTSIFTSDGLMLGNAIKKVASALGFKQCLACAGRQRSYNARGLELQRKLKELF